MPSPCSRVFTRGSAAWGSQAAGVGPTCRALGAASGAPYPPTMKPTHLPQVTGTCSNAFEGGRHAPPGGPGGGGICSEWGPTQGLSSNGSQARQAHACLRLPLDSHSDCPHSARALLVSSAAGPEARAHSKGSPGVKGDQGGSGGGRQGRRHTEQEGRNAARDCWQVKSLLGLPPPPGASSPGTSTASCRGSVLGRGGGSNPLGHWLQPHRERQRRACGQHEAEP